VCSRLPPREGCPVGQQHLLIVDRDATHRKGLEPASLLQGSVKERIVLKEAILAQFFEGKITGAKLANDLDGSERRISQTESIVKIEDMQEEFFVSREMAIRLCDAILRNELPPESLANIGFALIASDKFSWDFDDVLGEIIFDWSAPEINYELTIENVGRFRGWLLGVEEYPAKSL
jgi:hypothetical protein